MSSERGTVEGCERCIEGCDITTCDDCGEEYTDPCARHREYGHVPSSDCYDDGSGCSSCCASCHGTNSEMVPDPADYRTYDSTVHTCTPGDLGSSYGCAGCQNPSEEEDAG